MTDKYYVETIEDQGDMCGCELLHIDQPFNTIDEAKSWANTAESHGGLTIYRCSNNILTPVLTKNFGWEEIKDKS